MKQLTLELWWLTSEYATLLDIHTVDTDALSHQDHPVKSVWASAELEKKCKYSKAVEACRASFMPFVQSAVDGVKMV